MEISVKYLSDVFWVLPESNPLKVPLDYTDDESTGIKSLCKLF